MVWTLHVNNSWEKISAVLLLPGPEPCWISATDFYGKRTILRKKGFLTQLANHRLPAPPLCAQSTKGGLHQVDLSARLLTALFIEMALAWLCYSAI